MDKSIWLKYQRAGCAIAVTTLVVVCALSNVAGQEAPSPPQSLDMKFPEPTVDINEIKQKYHAIVEAEAESHEPQPSAEKTTGIKNKKNRKHKKKEKNS